MITILSLPLRYDLLVMYVNLFPLLGNNRPSLKMLLLLVAIALRGLTPSWLMLFQRIKRKIHVNKLKRTIFYKLAN